MLKISLLTILAMLAGLLMRERARSRARALEKAGGCVNCHSQNVERDEQHARCLDCGYAGAADGGGALSRKETDALYNVDPRRPFGE